MKVSNNSSRLSITLVILIIVMIMAIFWPKDSVLDYASSPEETLSRITNYDYFVQYEEINYSNSVLIDTRNRFEYENDHLKTAINIPSSDLLKSSSLELLDKLVVEGKSIILYGSSPDSVNAPFILLYQLGYRNIFILSAYNHLKHDELITKNIVIEDTVAAINEYIEESIKKVEIAKKKLIEVNKPVPKKVVVKKKKKKMPVEGGC